MLTLEQVIKDYARICDGLERLEELLISPDMAGAMDEVVRELLIKYIRELLRVRRTE